MAGQVDQVRNDHTLLWFVVLAVGLLRAQGATVRRHLEKPTVTPQSLAR
jgi:hypothetical protein